MMQLNITTDYAIRAVLYLALRQELVTAGEISAAMGIPKSYILKITQKLVQAGIFTRTVGKLGGFMLAKKPEAVNLYEIISLMESTTKINRCLEADKYCNRFAADNCPVRNFYCLLQDELESKLKAITIAALLKNQSKK